MTYLFRTPDTKITHFFVRQLIKELHIMTGNRYMYVYTYKHTHIRSFNNSTQCLALLSTNSFRSFFYVHILPCILYRTEK